MNQARIPSLWVFSLLLIGCNANVTLNWWALQYPATIPNWAITTIGSTTVYGRIIAYNVTDVDPSSAGPGITAQLGWGSPSDSVDLWNWQTAENNTDYKPGSPSYNSSMDEYLSFLQPNKIGSFRYTMRFSGNSGATWVYADLTGSDDGFQVNETGTLDVISSGDLTAPSPVTGLQAFQSGATVALVWNPNTEADLAGYDVYRRSLLGSFLRIAGGSSTDFLDTITFGNFSYKVVAYDQSYNYANDSAIVSVSYSATGVATTGAATTAGATTAGATTGSATTGLAVTVTATTGTATTGASSPYVTFPRCITVNNTALVPFSAVLCVDLQFNNCEFEFTITADGASVYSPAPVPITQFKEFFESNTQNCNPGPFSCQVCTEWQNVTLNSVEASGCGDLSLKCFGVPLGPYALGCFKNTDVVPRCFGTCPNLCSYHGICDNAFCNCSQGYFGSDCSSDACPGNCGGSIRGTCVNNGCVCNSGFEGTGCSLYAGQQSGSSSGSNWRPYVIGFVVSFGGLAIIIAVGFFLYRRSKKTHFKGLKADNHLELDE